jgi:hypothetical protein
MVASCDVGQSHTGQDQQHAAAEASAIAVTAHGVFDVHDREMSQRPVFERPQTGRGNACLQGIPNGIE